MSFTFNLNLNQPTYGDGNLGGGISGVSNVQTVRGHRDGVDADIRSILRKSWNGPYITGYYYGNNNKKYGRVTTPFRAANNAGDFLGRVNYSCGGPNQVNPDYPGWKGHIGNIPNMCDGTGVPASTCNVRYVYDSSDYVTYKKQRAINQNYNDKKDGGYTNSSYVNLLAVRRGF